jgi:hypothetical protein
VNKAYPYLIIVMSLLFFYGKEGHPQQTFYNVPSGQITKKNRIFIQQQLTHLNTLQSNTTIDYGLGNRWEVGFNVFNWKWGRAPTPLEPTELGSDPKTVFLLNSQKLFQLTDTWGLAVGIEIGPQFTNIFNVSNLAHFEFTNLVWAPMSESWIRTVLGIYRASSFFYGGSRDQLGILAGAEYAFKRDQLHLLAEWVSGTSPFGNNVLGLAAFFNPEFLVTLGALSESFILIRPNGFILELTWIPN